MKAISAKDMFPSVLSEHEIKTEKEEREADLEGQVDERNASVTTTLHSLPLDHHNEDITTETRPPFTMGSENGDRSHSNLETTRTKLQTTVIMLCLCSSVFLAALDITIVTTALPTISGHFGSSAGYTWVGSAYLLANAASTPSWGKFSDIWGRKPILLCAVAIFFIGSLLSAVSISISMLIAARAIQGVGGGGLIVLVNIVIGDLFSMRSRGKYFGIVGLVWAFASAVGPFLGGIFAQKVSWRWCFYVNLPITGSVFVLLSVFLQIDNPKTPVLQGLIAVDWAGSLAVVGGTLMLLIGLELGGISYPWDSATVICLILFGILLMAIFLLTERKFARYPIMPLRLFDTVSKIAVFGTCFCHGVVFIAGTYFMPLYFQAILGATPLLSGVYFFAFAISSSLVGMATGIYIKTTGNYLIPIWSGFVLTVIGFGLFINFDAKPDWAKIILFQMIAGIGLGPNFQSPLIALQNFVAPGDIAAATAAFGFVRNLSLSISVVVGGVVFQNEMQKHHSSLSGELGSQAASAIISSSAGATVNIVKQLAPAQQWIVRQAFADSLRSMWIMYAAFAAVGLIMSLFISHQKLSTEHKVTKTGLVEEEAKRKTLQTKINISNDVTSISMAAGLPAKLGNCDSA